MGEILPEYMFRCGSCRTEVDLTWPIGEAPRLVVCDDCGGAALLVIGAGVQIAPSALEGKGANVRQIKSKDRALDGDMNAYKRMRKQGLQPEKIDGAASVENNVADGFDITWKERLSKVAPDEKWESVRRRAQEGLDEAASA